MTLTAEQQAQLTWLINYLRQGPASKFLDQRTSDELERIFSSECGFTCGCPGTLQEGLRDEPIATLLRLVLCVSEA